MRAIAVDDEKLALESLRIKLTHIDRISEVYTFSTPEEALDFFEENGADIVFLDINMTQMDGLALAKRLRQLKDDVLILFVTGYAEYALDAIKLHADGYLMKPIDEEDIERELDELAHLRRSPRTAQRIRVQCFGHFEVFADEKPITFSRAKSKELLAYLVDRRGAKCTAAQIAAVLWDDGLYDRSRQKQLGVVRAEMLKALRRANALQIISSARDALAVLPQTFSCDYYMALQGDTAAADTFAGEYMSAYSWAEFTTAAIMRTFPQ